MPFRSHRRSGRSPRPRPAAWSSTGSPRAYSPWEPFGAGRTPAPGIRLRSKRIVHLHPPFGEVGILKIPLQGQQVQPAFLVEVIVTIRAVILDDLIQRFRHGAPGGKGGGQKEGQEGEQPDTCRKARPQPGPLLAGRPAEVLLGEMIKMAHSRWISHNTYQPGAICNKLLADSSSPALATNDPDFCPFRPLFMDLKGRLRSARPHPPI